MKIGGLDSLKISAIHFRIGFLVLNLVLTVVIGTQALFAVFQKPSYPKLNPWPDPETLKDTGGPKAQTDGLVPLAVRISRGLGDKPPPTVTQAPGDTVKPPEGPISTGPDDPLPPGPLNDNWELSMCLVLPNPQDSYVVLKRKDPNSGGPGAAKANPAAPRITSRVVRPPVRAPGSKIQRVPGQAAPSDMKMLKVKDQWVDEEQKINIWVVDVKMNRMVYEDGSDGKWRQYALVRKLESIYNRKDGETSLKNITEPPPDPNNPEVKPEKHFHSDPLDRDSMFEKRKEIGSISASSGAARPSGPNAGHPANQPPRPPSRDELKQLGDIQKSPKFREELKKLSEKDRKVLESLGGAKK